MRRVDLDRMADEHFRYEANDDVDGVMATLADDAVHHLVGSPYGELRGTGNIRPFYTELFAAVRGEHVETVDRRYGDDFLVDESLWTGTLHDARLFGLPGRAGHVTFRLLHVLQFRDGLITREQVWPDVAAIAAMA